MSHKLITSEFVKRSKKVHRILLPEKYVFESFYRDNSRKDTAKYFKVSEDTIKKWIKQFNLSHLGKTVKKPCPSIKNFTEYYLVHTNRECALYWNVSVRLIQEWAKKFDVRRPQLELPDKETFVIYYSTHTQKETGIYFGISASYVRDLARSYGFKKNSKMISISQQRSPKTKKSTTIPLDIEEFEKYYFSHTLEQTAEKYNVSKNVVVRWRKELGLSDKSVEQINAYKIYGNNAFEIPDKTEFEQLYNTTSNEEVADYYGVDCSVICRWREKLAVARKANKWKDYDDIDFTECQRSIILGSLLGDGMLRPSSDVSNSSFCEIHGAKQKDYLLWKYNNLLPFSTSFSKRVGKGKKRLYDGTVIEDHSKISVGYNFLTMSHPLFTDLEKIWYARDYSGNYIVDKKGWRIKVVPDDLKLNELIVAIWYFDDGSHNRNTGNSIVFNTHSFTRDECEILCYKLTEMGYQCRVNTNRGKPIIRLSDKCYLSFMKMVSKYLPHECLRYKVDTTNHYSIRKKKFNK